MAYGGATVDARIVKPYQPSVKSLIDQVDSQFIPIYGSETSKAALWTSSDSLFATFIGINDVGGSWWLENATEVQDQIFAQQDILLETLHSAGARNFLFLNVPPVNLVPLTTEKDEWSVETEGKVIGVWNDNVRAMSERFQFKHPEVKIFEHNTHGVYSAVLEDPSSFEQTAELKNTTGYCKVYEK
jgi:phospholipase/lecithinase/hemolysin